jgi:hypothetical protein
MKLKKYDELYSSAHAWHSARGYGLLRKHGLSDWRFEIDDRYDLYGSVELMSNPRARGMCFAEKKLIVVDSYHVRTAPWREVRETILHEIAHALTPPLVKPHGAFWAMNARSLGVSDEDIAWSAKCDRRRDARERRERSSL